MRSQNIEGHAASWFIPAEDPVTMSRWNLAWLIGIASVALVGLAVSQSAPLRHKDQDYEMVRLFVDVLDKVESQYVRDLDPDARRKLIEDMINGGLERLDPHSTFINPRKYKQFTKDNKGKFGGVGIQVATDRQYGVLQVISPLVGTPAYDAGILAGDLITKIDGKSTETMGINDAVDLITGEPGQKVTLTVQHEGAKQPVDITLTRALIHVQSVLGDCRKPDNPEQWDFFIDKDYKIAYVRLISFSEDSAKELRETLTQLKNEGLRGLVLDLRLNPGGLLKAAVEISNLFISEGKIVSTKGRDGQDEAYDAETKDALLVPARDFPMAVLVNRFSASASEIVAAALQDHDRAVIVGERSYGKGSVQNVIRMENGASALKLTTASYWRPSGKNINRFPDSKDTDEWGVKPSPGFEVRLHDGELRQYIDYQRQCDIVHGKPGSSSPSTPHADQQIPRQVSQPKTLMKFGPFGLTIDSAAVGKIPFHDRVLDKALVHVREQLKGG